MLLFRALCCPRGLPLLLVSRLSLALRPGALLAGAGLRRGLSEVLLRPGMDCGVFGMDGRVIFLATGLSAPHASPLGGKVNALRRAEGRTTLLIALRVLPKWGPPTLAIRGAPTEPLQAVLTLAIFELKSRVRGGLDCRAAHGTRLDSPRPVPAVFGA